MKKIYFAIMALTLVAFSVSAQETNKKERKTFYSTAGGDGGILSLGKVEMNGRNINPTLRYSPVFNFGTNFHWDATKNAGLFVGWNVRNIGLITDDNPAVSKDRFKRRLYTFGVPLAIKLGDLEKENFFYAGAEVSMAVHYKEKRFIDGDRKKKEKFNEWFSDRTPRIMTSAFAGFHFRKNFSIKAQYFFTNFFNTDYRNGATNYATYKANPYFVTFGYDFDIKEVFSRKKKK
jgi:hypothetical protein